MILSRLESLRSIIESEDDIHISIYIGKCVVKKQLRKKINNAAIEATKYLKPALTDAEIDHLIEPINGLAKSEVKLKDFNGDLAIFRNRSVFRVLSLPSKIGSDQCIVADTFHVKPLLKWVQMDREFFLLGLEQHCANLYWGNLDSIQLIDTRPYELRLPHPLLKPHLAFRQDGVTEWVNRWISGHQPRQQPRLFMSGVPRLAAQISAGIHYRNIETGVIFEQFSSLDCKKECAQIRTFLSIDAKRDQESILRDFGWAAQARLIESNIFEIARAVAGGRVGRLLIAGDQQIFGKFNRKIGSLAIHPGDLDHQDDDLLDDLAQTVFQKGGEVTVAPRARIPGGRPLLAILKQDDLLRVNPYYCLNGRGVSTPIQEAI